MEDFSINMEAKHCAKNLELSEKIEHLARNPTFITLKHHKENLNSILPCHLINPSKSELGKVSKQKLDKISQIMVQHLNLNQWKNSTRVTKWFTAFENKTEIKIFIKFDIQEFYNFITEDILKTSLSFPTEYQNIPEDICIMNIATSLYYSMIINLVRKKMLKAASM